MTTYEESCGRRVLETLYFGVTTFCSSSGGVQLP